MFDSTRTASPAEDDPAGVPRSESPLLPPARRFAALPPLPDTPRTNSGYYTDNSDAPLFSSVEAVGTPTTEYDENEVGNDKIISLAVRNTRRRRRSILLSILAAALVLLFLVIFVPVYLKVGKDDSNRVAVATPHSSTPSTSTSASTAAASSTASVPTSGRNGSLVTTENGTTFTYVNNFNGYWAYDASDPYGLSGKANEWTPALNETWVWGRDHVYGVNLGGLFVLEPFISPAIFQNGMTVLDEWQLSQAMSSAGTLEEGLESHYDQFITEEDIAQIAGAGLNWVRLPVPYWAIPGSVWEGEPFLEGICWKYILRLIGWARKYGIRVMLDLHTIPGSQNGWNHSGKQGSVNFLHGAMGVANAQRALEYIRTYTEFFSQSEYQDVVVMFGYLNEPMLSAIGQDTLEEFYVKTQGIARNITGYGAGNGFYLSIHDGFAGLSAWVNTLTGFDRLAIDMHPYLCFSGEPGLEPVATGTDPADAGGAWPETACDAWADSFNTSRSAFGVTVAGEFSCATNNCGLFLNGVGGISSYGGDCSFWEDASQWNASVIAGLQEFSRAQMDAFGDWFYWTWKVGESTSSIVESPLWSYKLGLELGFIPSDPRTALGKCAAIGVAGTQFSGTYAASATGALGTDPASYALVSSASAYGMTWPPATVSGVDGATAAGSELPTYTATDVVSSLPAIVTLTVMATDSKESAYTISAAVGWYDSQDTASAPTPVASCSYPDAWDATTVGLPATSCTSGITARATYR
ncbi:glycoside hydrolase [Fistulina hepatica ATCC 64428]|uniref:glucan 1,3-beta-glucosidase n=1 Tax=Fistulina hepatica ATCC 64428 TaxID=1128425 RepID=A0A0D7AQZ6_9AGAR|nr:glycoside hydrolase [Fistulina hepatica ATCC 64428]